MRRTEKSSAWLGDGGLTSVIGALATAVELNVPVLWVLFNNFCFSTIRTVGTTYFNNAYGTEFTRPDGTPYNPEFHVAGSRRLASSRRSSKTRPNFALRSIMPGSLTDRTFSKCGRRGDVPMPRTGYWDIADF